MSFEAVVRRPVYLQVAEQIREAILSGELLAGNPLPPERDLCDRFTVSRATVREALRGLQAQGLVVAQNPTAPLRVAAPEELSSGQLHEVLGHLVRLGVVPLGDLVDMRCALEAAAVASAANSHPPADLTEARSALADMRAATDFDAFEMADIRFHVELVAASGNQAIHLVMLAVRHTMGAYLLAALEALDDPVPVTHRLIDEHAEILEAVAAGDADRAEDLVRAHIGDFYRQLGAKR